MVTEIRNLIKETMGQTILEDIDHVNDNDSLYMIGIDSLNIIQLVLALEDHFGIEFEEEDIDMDNFETVSKIADIIKGLEG